jgi:hypothetical protein
VAGISRRLEGHDRLHARCDPQDAVQYVDYVLGVTDKAVIRDLSQDCAAH